MKKDINKIEELNKENEELEQKNRDLVKAAREAAGDEGDWYSLIKDQLNENDDKISANKREAIIIKATNIDVGDGISLSPFTDWDAYTVIERRETPKGFVLTIQEDDAIRTDSNGMSDSQTYRFEKNPDGPTKTVKWNPRTNWFTCGVYKIALGRHAYYDYSF